jgi:AraC-like DNA-binding protein
MVIPSFTWLLQGLVFAVILVLRGLREERISDYLAALLLIFGSLYIGQWMLGFAGWYDNHDWRTTVMFYIEWKNLLALGPLIWLYFRSLTNTDFRWKRSYWLHFLPLLLLFSEPVFAFLYDWVYWRGILGNPFEFFHGTRGPAAEWGNDEGLGFWWYAFITIFSFLHLGYYLIRTIQEYRQYRKYLLREFSNAEQLTLISLRVTLYLLFVGVSVTFLLEIWNQVYSKSYIDSWDSFFAMSLFNFFVAIQFLAINPNLTRALRFEPGTKPEPSESEQGVRPVTETKSEPDPELETWAAKLDNRLASHEDYLNPDLKLGDLAESLKTNTSVLSRVINGVYGKNFNDFINGLRCDAFTRAIVRGDHERHTLLSIALDCGFNSKSTFNRAFRKHKGYSPGEAVKRTSLINDLGADAGGH